MADHELIEYIIHNSEEGIKQAIQQYGAIVNAVIIKIIGANNVLDVQECVSNVFIKLWQYSQHFNEGKGSLKGYIVAIARNEAFSKLKIMKKSNMQQSLDDMDGDIGIDIDMTNDLAVKVNNKIICEMVDALKEPDRQIFIRRHYWGERIKVIATSMNLEEKFIENRLYLSKKLLRKQLEEKGVVL